MVGKIVTVTFEGVDARRVDVEVQMPPRSSGPAYFGIVGLGDRAVGESRDRVKAAGASSRPPAPCLRRWRPGPWGWA